MAVLLGYIKSMGSSRKEYKVAWATMSVTMIRHIIKVLIIKDNQNFNKWLGELDNYLDSLVDKHSNANFKKDALYKEIYQEISISNKDISRFVKGTLKRYLNDDTNKGYVDVRHYNNNELVTDINDILRGFLGLMRFFKTRNTSYEQCSVEQIQILTMLIKNYHTRDSTRITNPDKEIK